MKTVLVLSALGILSLVVLSQGDRTPPPAVESPAVLPPESEAPLGVETGRPSAESEPMFEQSVSVSRAGPRRHLKAKKPALPPVELVSPIRFVPEKEPKVLPEKALEALIEQMIRPEESPKIREYKYYSRAGPKFHLKQKQQPKPAPSQIE